MSDSQVPIEALDKNERPWQSKVRRRVYASALLSRSFLIINLLATVVASYGLLANSTAVVIGAMLIATLLGPISGIALALVDANQSLLRRAIVAEIFGALLVIAVSFVIGTIHSGIPLSGEILSRTHPNLLDLMIALGGGAAGGFATVNKRLSQGLAGTAIATALVPPLASCGICMAHGQFRLGLGAFLLFFANLIAIQFASSAVLWLAGYRRLLLMKGHRGIHLLRNGVSVAVLLALGSTFAVNFGETIARENYDIELRKHLETALRIYPGTHLVDVAVTDERATTVILAVVRTPYSFTPDRVRSIEDQLPRKGSPLELHIQSVLVKETTRDGYLHETHKPEASPDGMTDPGPSATPGVP